MRILWIEIAFGSIPDLADAPLRSLLFAIQSMRYWWVNQGQTHRHELEGGYLWSPKRQKNQAKSQYYENMKAVAPGDAVFCYWDTELRAQGTLRSFGYDAPKPEEFGQAGRNWSKIGYRADVEFTRLVSPVRPRDYWQQIRALLPAHLLAESTRRWKELEL